MRKWRLASEAHLGGTTERRTIIAFWCATHLMPIGMPNRSMSTHRMIGFKAATSRRLRDENCHRLPQHPGAKRDRQPDRFAGFKPPPLTCFANKERQSASPSPIMSLAIKASCPAPRSDPKDTHDFLPNYSVGASCILLCPDQIPTISSFTCAFAASDANENSLPRRLSSS
jgi:hypothetical protein